MSDRVPKWIRRLHRDCAAATAVGLTVKGVLLGQEQLEQLRAAVASDAHVDVFGKREHPYVWGLPVVASSCASAVLPLTAGVGVALDEGKPPYLTNKFGVHQCPKCGQKFVEPT